MKSGLIRKQKINEELNRRLNSKENDLTTKANEISSLNKKLSVIKEKDKKINEGLEKIYQLEKSLSKFKNVL